MSLIPQGICTAVVSMCPDHIMTTYTAQHLCHMLGVRDSSQPEVLVRGHCWYKSVAVNTGALCLLGLHVEGQQSHNSLKHCNKEIHFLRWYLPSDVCQHRLPSVPPDKPPSACPLLKEIAIMTETFWWLWKTHLLKYKKEKWKTELESKSWNMVCITELQWMRQMHTDAHLWLTLSTYCSDRADSHSQNRAGQIWRNCGLEAVLYYHKLMCHVSCIRLLSTLLMRLGSASDSQLSTDRETSERLLLSSKTLKVWVRFLVNGYASLVLTTFGRAFLLSLFEICI